MGLLKEAYENVLLNEEFGKDGVLYLYHATLNDAVSGIFNKGFEREFTGTNGGNMYGREYTPLSTCQLMDRM